MNRHWQYISSLLLGGSLYLLNEWSSNYAGILCLILILIVGIPHGAVDHKIHLTTTTDRSVIKYVVNYLLIAGAYIFWWLFDPAKALLMFLLLSAYHFGQELLEDNHLTVRNALSSLVWGMAILVAPILLSYQEVHHYFEIIAGKGLPAISYTYRIIGCIVIYVIALIDLVWHTRKGHLQKSNIFNLLLFLAFIMLLHLSLDFLLAFTLYFVFFHSLNAFKHQYTWLSTKKANYTYKRFIKDLIGFGSLAGVGIILLLLVLKPPTMDALVTYFFILTSLITLPHAITLDQFYRVKSQTEKGRISHVF